MSRPHLFPCGLASGKPTPKMAWKIGSWWIRIPFTPWKIDMEPQKWRFLKMIFRGVPRMMIQESPIVGHMENPWKSLRMWLIVQSQIDLQNFSNETCVFLMLFSCLLFMFPRSFVFTPEYCGNDCQFNLNIWIQQKGWLIKHKNPPTTLGEVVVEVWMSLVWHVVNHDQWGLRNGLFGLHRDGALWAGEGWTKTDCNKLVYLHQDDF